MKIFPRVKSGPAFLVMAVMLFQSVPIARSSPSNPLAPEPTVVAAVDCNSRCNSWKTKVRPAHTTIDANTGAFIDGTLDYDADQQPQVIFVNKNPFKYNYRYEIKNEPTAVAIAADFFGLVPGFGDILASARGQAIQRSAGGAPFNQACTPAEQALWEALRAAAMPVTAESAAIKTALQQKSTLLEETVRPKYDGFLSLIERGINENNCVAVCEESESTRTVLKDFKLDGLPDRVKTFKESVKALDSLIEAFETNSTPNCRVEKRAELNTIKQLKPDADKYEEASKKMEESKKTFDKIVKIIDSALTSDNPFVDLIEVPAGRGARTIRVRIFRLDQLTAGAKETEVTQVPIEITVGESPISVSAGIGFSTIPDRRIVRQSASLPNPEGGTRLGTVFGFEQNSSFKPSAVVMLNASLPRRFNFFGTKNGSFAASSGLVVSSRNGNTEVEFILGPSLGFLDNFVFATFGFHAAKVESLAGNFEIGDEVPADLTDPLPIERSWKKGFMFSLTFKIR